MEKRFQEHITTHFSYLFTAPCIVACSGGLDSVVLVHLMKSLGLEFGIAHCNFSLRGRESDEDQTFVASLAQSLEAPFFMERFDTESYVENRKVSTQMAARELRYAWFANLLDTTKFEYVLTAHHADDALETFLINLSRGTGLRGLRGIPEENSSVVRPLLPFSREEIFNYAKSKDHYWREDSSNSNTEYLRNSIRLNVIPPLKDVSASLLTNFSRTQRQLQGSSALVEDYMALIYNLVVTEVAEGYQLNIQKLKELPNTKDLMYELLHPFGFTAWEDISRLLEGQSGKHIFSPTHRLLRDRDVLILTLQSNEEGAEGYLISEGTLEIREPINLSFKVAQQFEITNANTVFVNPDKLEYPLLLRKWREGDVFQPFGMEGKKKLSKFFKDEKLSLVAKENVWVLCSSQTIVWVVGQRMDERFKVSKQDNSMIRIDYTP